MAHQALYRKYRSRNFDEVVGQNSLVQTLKNQVISNNIAHAYLFCGIRGTGKTSAAKILARAINCTENVDGNPCNECPTCKSVLEDKNVDVVEMDAASNNSVEDIRDIVEKVNFMPVSCKYKVYIIDEVHMLSKGAFNALLKTLEEPPKHVIFILATTEPQKIPATILSRCQRFDLKRITTDDMVKHMSYILDDLSFAYEERALRVIASNADGAMRDALSILDRCITFCENGIVFDEVINLLGIVSFDTISNIASNMIEKNISESLLFIDNLLLDGKDLLLLLDELIVYFRNLLVYKSTKSIKGLIKISEDNVLELEKNAEKISTNHLIKIVSKLSELVQECKRADNARVIFEVKMIDIIANYDSNNGTANVESNHSKKLNESSTIKRDIIKKDYKDNIQVSTKLSKEKTHVKESYTNNNEESNKKVFENKSDEEIYSNIRNNWQNIMVAIRKKEITLFAIFRECKPKNVSDGLITFEIGKDKSWHFKAVNQEKNRMKVTEILSDILNTKVEVNFVMAGEKIEEKQEVDLNYIENDLKASFGNKLEIK